jgi:serine/threonine-protein kinase
MTTTEASQSGVRPGDVLAGKYRVERVLGAGGMGVVVAAHHLQLDQKVALKFLLPAALSNADAVGRFLREARAAVKITGEHVARVLDVGQLENGSPYIVMEYLQGLDLAGWLTERGPLPIELAVDFLLQTCEAIADAHALGIVHRDLKPANLFCVERSDGQLSIKVLDFGISKVTTPGAAGHDMTRTHALVGSPYYMSPEQMQSSKNVDPRTDIWSMGIILFELLAGRTPFDAESVTELAIKVATTRPPSVRSFRPEVPPELEAVIATCLQKEPGQRYQTVGELAVALKDFGSKQARASVERVLGTLRRAGISGPVLPPSGEFRVRTVSIPGSGPIPAPITTASWGDSAASPRPRSRATLVAVTLVGLAVLSLGGTLLFLRKPPATVTAVPAAASTPAVAAPTASSPPAAAPASSDPPAVSLEPLPAAPSSSASARATAKPPAWPSRATVGAPPPAAATAPAPASCDPPFTLDQDGRKHFKPECYLKK